MISTGDFKKCFGLLNIFDYFDGKQIKLHLSITHPDTQNGNKRG
jgi:hypothetical protein